MKFMKRIFSGRPGATVTSSSKIAHEAEEWDLDQVVLSLAPFDALTLRHAVEGIAIFGGVGAAKTTGSAAQILLGFLSLGMGGLYCCVKPGDRELIEWYAAQTGRADSLIIVSPSQPWRCNLLKYALKRPGMEGSRTEQVVSVLMTIAETAERGEKGGGGRNDRFWEQSKRSLLRDAVEICVRATGEISMAMVDEFIASAPQTHEQVHEAAWQQKSLCYRLVEQGDQREMTQRERKDFDRAARFFLREFIDMPPETRGSVLASYRVMADVLLRGQMADLFDGATNFVPDVAFDGAVIVLDLPVKVYGQAGVHVQSAFKYLFEVAAEQRDVKANSRPAFLFMDEAHELITDYDMQFFATARSARIASVLISQNISNYFAAMGGESGRHRIEGVLGNLSTKIFHSNGHAQTNKWASDMIADEMQTRVSFHGSRERTGMGTGGGSEAPGKKVLESEFTMLSKGGPENDYLTQTILFQSGRRFAANNGQPYLYVTFRQHIPGIVSHQTGK